MTILFKKLFVVFAISLLTNSYAQTNAITINNQLVESRIAPVGIDVNIPRFSWQITGANGLQQSAYQIQIQRMDSDFANENQMVWNSGWVTSDQSHLISYAGKPLQSSSPYFWRVRIKNENGLASAWSKPTRWVTGLLNVDKEFKAEWIGFDKKHPYLPDGVDWFEIGKAKWIASSTKKTETYYRSNFQVPAKTTRVMVGMELSFTGQIFINGKEVLQGGRFETVPSYLDVTPWIKTGNNQISARVSESSLRYHPGIIASIRIENEDGTSQKIFTNETWESTTNKVDLWNINNNSNENWKPVTVLGSPGNANPIKQGDTLLFSPKFGSKVFSPPAAYLRKEIKLSKPIRFAVFHGTAQGLFDVYINGQRITKTGLQPGWTQFEKHVDYVSFDVTQLLKTGKNAIGAVLADGWFRGNLLWFGREKFGDKMRFSGQLEIEFEDGSHQTVSTDNTWKASFGPILQSDIMNGEIYDARLEQNGWSNIGFNDITWSSVNSEPRVKSTFVQRQHLTETVEVETELIPKTITEPKPDVYVIDFGQNFAGWARLRIKEKAGQTIINVIYKYV